MFSKILKLPLYSQIIIALGIAVVLGIVLGAGTPITSKDNLEHLALPAKLIIRALSTLATPLIFLSIINTLLTSEIPGNAAKRLGVLLTSNTVVAIGIGLLVANVVKPGSYGKNLVPEKASDLLEKTKSFDPWQLLDGVVPDSIVKPFADKTSVISLILLALATGVALRSIKQHQLQNHKTDYQPIEQVIGILFNTIIKVLHWVIALVPLAVLGIVAKTIAIQGFSPFQSLLAFILAVILALSLQATYYLLRVNFGSWVSPRHFLTTGIDPLVAAFSTASSTATMPITYETLIEKVGLRRSSASLGALVGSNFNNDGTALYEAISALFIAQVLNLNLNLSQQLMVMLTSIFASVGAAGIPEAGLVTMSLVFNSVGLPAEYITILLTVDWFLDRVRTAINVMGDMTVSSLIDGRERALVTDDLLESAPDI
jgi:DAACS family dicarboxylate/amino acid:cation (Na+ or H+) symporter